MIEPFDTFVTSIEESSDVPGKKGLVWLVSDTVTLLIALGQPEAAAKLAKAAMLCLVYDNG